MQTRVWLLSIMLVCVNAAAQTRLQLAPTEVRRAAWLTGSPVAPLKCDGEGNIYGRFAAGSLSSFDIVKIAPDGSKKAAFTSSGVPELKDVFISDFAVGDNGSLYALADLPTGRSIVLSFSRNGNLEVRTELEQRQPVSLSQFASLRNGYFFVSGTHANPVTGRGSGQPYVAIYSGAGKIVREITLKNDSQPPKSKTLPDEPLNPAVLKGHLLSGEDGNVYIVRHTSPVLVFVVSPAGELLRSLTIAAPVERGMPVAFAIYRSHQLAIEFSVADAPDVTDTTIRVVNAQTGQLVADYKITRELTEAMACYSGNTFTFLGNSESWPAVIQAAAH